MNIVQNKNRDGENEKPKWVDNLIEQLAEIHPALPSYFCTGLDRDVLVPIFYEGKAEQEAWMEKNRLIRLIPDGYINNGVRDLLCSIFAHYSENVLLYPIWKPIWAISAYKRAMTDPDFGLGEALSQASGSS